MVARAVWSARVRGLTVVGCLLGAGAVLARPRAPLGTFGYRSWSMYPWWAWVLAGAGLVVLLPFAVGPQMTAGGRT
jgi:hypothetical protein